MAKKSTKTSEVSTSEVVKVAAPSVTGEEYLRGLSNDDLLAELKARLADFLTWKAAHDFLMEQLETVRKGGAYMVNDDPQRLYKASEYLVMSTREVEVPESFRSYRMALAEFTNRIEITPQPV